MTDWGYGEQNGPMKWVDMYKENCGMKQSPIDVKTCDCVPAQDIRRPLVGTWESHTKSLHDLCNTGASWQVNASESGGKISGGPLEYDYELLQYHMHWGKCYGKGSEHTVDGQQYDAEIHLVHWNHQQYNNIGDALECPYGLAVIGVLIEIGESNPELQKVVENLPSILKKGDSVKFEGIEIASFLKGVDLNEYWTYPGSLTTPPLKECITWLLMKDRCTVSAEQLEAMRTLSCSSGDRVASIVENCRPTQPLNGRIVRTSSGNN